jgi:hypothetical protein
MPSPPLEAAMREAAYLLIVLLGFLIVGTVDVQVAEGMLGEHAPVVTIASTTLEDRNHARTE